MFRIYGRLILLFWLLASGIPSAFAGEPFLCAGFSTHSAEGMPEKRAAKAVVLHREGIRSALVLFARFKGEAPEKIQAPAWADDIFDSDLPGSFTHFYDTMSFGRLHVTGEVMPRYYTSVQKASAYLAESDTSWGAFGQFSLEILQQADADVDFSRFDNDGPDGISDSGDDDGVVDVVFLLTVSTPANFLFRRATGVGTLGLDKPFVTDDIGIDGQPIRIASRHGAVQRGHTFTAAAGAMCHEYGHLLGLPDLYDTAFLRRRDAGPEEDSAGIGNWGLMGRGTLGWFGNDGPSSFCAWSRMKLGWARVGGMSREREELRLPEVGREGDVYKIPFEADEFFLLEHRLRTSTFYDRHLPGEGLLIWHVGPQCGPGSGLVDLECADGRWLDAGYPLGEEPDSRWGGDNLDFWAHDETYAQAHGGNLGDATDPFDGIHYRAFTPETNPDSYGCDGRDSVRIEEIRFEGDVAIAQVQTDPAVVEIGTLRVLDASKDEILTFGEEGTIRFRILNRGGVKARNVRVVLSTEDPLLEVVQAEATFGDIEVGYFSGNPSDGGNFPRIRVVGEFSRVKQFSLSLDLYMDNIWAGRHDFQIEAVFSYVLSGRITDEEGNGLAGVDFSVQSTGGDEYRSFNIRTGEDGTFEKELPPGGYLFLRMSGAGGFAPQMFSFQVLEDKHLDVVLVKTFPVSGTVRDPEGNPLSGASLWSFPANTRTTTAQDGTYTLRLSRGQNSIQIERKSSDPTLTFPPQTFEEVQVDGARRFDMTLRRGVRVAVQVVDEEGGGIGSIRFFASGSSLSDAQTDAEGMAVIALLPDVYNFHVSQPRAPYLSTTVPFLAISADTTVQIPLRKGFAILGSVRDESVAPFFSASLLFTPLDTDDLVSIRIADDGTYRTLLPPGRFQTVFFPTGPGSNTAQSLGTIRIAGDGIFDFVVEPGMRIGGWLRDEEGRALPGKEILAHSAQTSVAGNARTLDDGSFEFFLKPGPYEFLASRNWTAFWYLGVFDVPPLDGFSFHLPVGASMSGRVFDASGAPVHRALVVLTQDPRTLTVRAIPDPDAPPSFSYNGAGFAAAAVSEVNGTFHVSVRPGTYTTLVLPYFGRGIGVVRKEVSLSGKHIQDFVLPTFDALHLVYGRIVDEPDVPHGQVVLQFYDESTGIVGQTTNSNSRSYSMSLPPGCYQVRAGLFSPVQGFYKVYDVGGVEVEGDRRWDIRLSESTTVVTETKSVLPECTILEQNYPNPFNTQTTIAYQIPQEGKVRLTIYNILGQPVRRLVDRVQHAGPHQVSWDGRDKGGRMVGSGVYVYRLQAGKYQQIRRLVLLK